MDISCCSEETFFLFQWINTLIQWFVYDLLGIYPLDPLAKLLRFFLMNLSKTTIIIGIMLYGIGLLRAGFKPEQARRLLQIEHSWKGYLLGALLGIITPFCSCSAVPIFLAFTASRIPLGVTIAFLVSAPMVTEAGVVLTLEAFGITFTLITIIAALASGISAGILFDYLASKGMKLVLPQDVTSISLPRSSSGRSLYTRHEFALNDTKRILTKIAPWLLFSVIIATLLKVYLPPNATETILSRQKWWSVPSAVLIGVPLYGTSGTIIPVALVLYSHGVALGTVLAFILSVNGASIPAFLLLRSALTTKGLLILFATFIVMFTTLGYLINFAQGYL